MTSRHAGLMLPLFSAASTSSWGVGELPDIVPLARWMARGGYSRVMILPIGTVPDGETSPYSAISAMAIDPIYIALEAMEDFQRAGGLDGTLDGGPPAPRRRARVGHGRVTRTSAGRSVRRSTSPSGVFSTRSGHTAQSAPRSLRPTAHANDGGSTTTRCITRRPRGLDKRPGATGHRRSAIAIRRRSTTRDGAVRRRCSAINTCSGSPSRNGRRRAPKPGRRASPSSAICRSWWPQRARMSGRVRASSGSTSRSVFRRTRSATRDRTGGCRPRTGTRSPVRTTRGSGSERRGWRRSTTVIASIISSASTARTAGRRPAPPFFSPSNEEDQIRQGEHILRLLVASGAGILGEDLGVVPDFLRPSLARLNIAGCKVLRWERLWKEPGQPFIDPATYPPVSAAMTGTHDTEPMADWWDAASLSDRAAFIALPLMRAAGLSDPGVPWHDALRHAMLETMWHAGSTELLVPIQDVFGWRRSHQHAGHGERSELDVAPAVAGESARRRAGGARRAGDDARAGKTERQGLRHLDGPASGLGQPLVTCSSRVSNQAIPIRRVRCFLSQRVCSLS